MQKIHDEYLRRILNEYDEMLSRSGESQILGQIGCDQTAAIL